MAESFVGAVVSQGGGVVGPAAHGAVPVADQGVRHHQGDVIRVGPPAALRRERVTKEDPRGSGIILNNVKP